MTPRKLVHVQRQILLTHMMKTADDSALKQRPKRINMSGMDVTAHVLALAMFHRFVVVSLFLQKPIAGVFIGRNQRNLIRDGFTDKAVQGGGIGIRDHLRHNHAFTGDSADYSHFTSGATAQFAAMERSEERRVGKECR